MKFHKDGSVTNTARKLRSILDTPFTSIINNHLNADWDSDVDSEETASQEVSSKEKNIDTDVPADSIVCSAKNIIIFPKKPRLNTPINF